MIANELNRGRKLCGAGQAHDLELSYERVLNLLDLTVQVQVQRTRRRELLRGRDLVAALYLAPAGAAEHERVMKAFLRLTPESYAQLDALFPA